MTATEAYKILSKEHPLMRVRSCLDFGAFYGFFLAPMNVEDDEDYAVGTCMEAVDKKTGNMFIYDITSDLDAYDRAKVVEVQTIFDRKVKNL